MTQQRSRCSAQPARPTANDDDSTTARRRSQDAAGPTQSSLHATAPSWRTYRPTACTTRVFRTVPPQELTDAAHKAARLIDTDALIQTASRSYTRALWHQSRVWDPDD